MAQTFEETKSPVLKNDLFLLIPLEVINQVPQKQHKEVVFLSLEGHLQIIDF